MNYSYFLRSLVLLGILFISSCAKNVDVEKKTYVETKECLIPISKTLEIAQQRSKYEYSYIEKEEYFDLYSSSQSLTILNSSNLKEKSWESLVNSKYMNEKSRKNIGDVQVIYAESVSKKPYISTITIITIGRTTIIAQDYSSQEITEIINFCKTHKRKKD